MTGQAVVQTNGTNVVARPAGRRVSGVPARPAPADVADHPLRRLRRRRGLTLVVLADLSGLSASFLSMVENGQRALNRRDHVNAVAAALHVAPAEIAPGTVPGFDEWAPSPPALFPAFPAVSDETAIARHRDLARKLMGYVTHGDTYAAGAWLRRTARDPSVNPRLLLDRLTANQISRPSPRSRLVGASKAPGMAPAHREDGGAL